MDIKYHLFTLLLITDLSSGYEHVCRNVVEPKQISIRHFQSSIASLSATPTKLRIGIAYSNNLLALPQFEQIKVKIIQPAVDFWSNTLSAKSPLSSNLLVQRTCVGGLSMFIKSPTGAINSYCVNGCESVSQCSEAVVPDQYLDQCRELINGQPRLTGMAGPGFANADFLVLMNAQQTSTCLEGTLAYATFCELENSLNRPILGYVNLCPYSLSLNQPGLTTSYYTVVHELAHALGFHHYMYAFMRDENGLPRTPRHPISDLPNLGTNSQAIYTPSNSTISPVLRTWISAKGTFTRVVQLLKTPKLLSLARNHFNCPSLDGVDMENQGGIHTLSSHFEKRVLMNDLMTGVIDGAAVVSKMTLGFFEDSGWYTVNYSNAEPWKWGQNMGCSFVQKSCYEHALEQKKNNATENAWCDYSSQVSPMQTCNLVKRATLLDPEFQYFTSLPGIQPANVPYYGGKYELADYCALQVSISSGTKSLTNSVNPNGESSGGQLIIIILMQYFIHPFIT